MTTIENRLYMGFCVLSREIFVNFLMDSDPNTSHAGGKETEATATCSLKKLAGIHGQFLLSVFLIQHMPSGIRC